MPSAVSGSAYALFLAAYPGAEEAARIAWFADEWNQANGLGGALRKPELLHVTLVDLTKLKEPPQAIIEKAKAAAARIAMPAFTVQFDRVFSFSGSPRSKPLIVTGGDGAAGLVALQRALVVALQKEWLKLTANPGYTPHMTLLYSAKSVAEQTVLPMSWRVQDFALIKSHAGQSRHEVIDRWPLSGA